MKLLTEEINKFYVIQVRNLLNKSGYYKDTKITNNIVGYNSIDEVERNLKSADVTGNPPIDVVENENDATQFIVEDLANEIADILHSKYPDANVNVIDVIPNLNSLTPEQLLDTLDISESFKANIKENCMKQFTTIINSYGRDINDNPFLVYLTNLDSKYSSGGYSGPAFTITPNLLNILLNDYGRIVDYSDFNNLNEDNIFMDNYFTKLTNSEQIVYIIQVYNWFQNSYNVRNYITDDANILKQFGVTDKNDIKTLCMNVLKQGGKGEYNPAKVIENNLLKLENKNTKTLSSGNTSKNTTQIKTQSRNSERWNKFLGSKGEDIKNLSAADKEDLLSYIYSLSDNNTSTIGGEI